MLALSVLAGAFIALGAVLSTVATASQTRGSVGGVAPGMPFGVSRLLGGLTFSLGLVLVVIAGAELFTGNTLVVMAWASRRVRTAAVLRSWAIVYLGNLVGAVFMAALVFWSGHTVRDGGSVGRRALEIARTKTSLSVRDAVLLGVLANVLVCLAMWLTLSARSVIDKVAAVVLPVTAFVAAGFEHSVANMYFIPAGLLIKEFGGATFWIEAGLDESAFDAVSLHSFLLDNLLPVTVGNMIGGSVLVGLVYWFVYLRGEKTA
jgi:formate/nitrite transporter